MDTLSKPVRHLPYGDYRDRCGICDKEFEIMEMTVTVRMDGPQVLTVHYDMTRCEK